MAPSVSASLARSTSPCSAMTSSPTCTLASRMWRTASRPSDSPKRRLVTTASRRALDPAGDAGQRLVETGGIRAAALRQVRAPAALAADGLRDLLDELAGLQALAEVLGDGRDEVDLAVDGRAQA